MEVEHFTETIVTHTVVDSLNHTYHTLQNVRKRLELVFKTQSLWSNTILKNFRKPVKKISAEKKIVGINDNVLSGVTSLFFYDRGAQVKAFSPNPN